MKDPEDLNTPPPGTPTIFNNFHNFQPQQQQQPQQQPQQPQQQPPLKPNFQIWKNPPLFSKFHSPKPPVQQDHQEFSKEVVISNLSDHHLFHALVELAAQTGSLQNTPILHNQTVNFIFYSTQHAHCFAENFRLNHRFIGLQINLVVPAEVSCVVIELPYVLQNSRSILCEEVQRFGLITDIRQDQLWQLSTKLFFLFDDHRQCSLVPRTLMFMDHQLFTTTINVTTSSFLKMQPVLQTHHNNFYDTYTNSSSATSSLFNTLSTNSNSTSSLTPTSTFNLNQFGQQPLTDLTAFTNNSSYTSHKMMLPTPVSATSKKFDQDPSLDLLQKFAEPVKNEDVKKRFQPKQQKPQRNTKSTKPPLSNTPSNQNLSTKIDLQALESGKEQRTTVMVCNIPNKLEFEHFKKFVDETSLGTYCFLYLRFDFSNRCNVGYAFISFAHPKDLKLFVEKRAGMKWNSQNYNSEKVIEIKFARIQGYENLQRKFKSSPVMSQEPAFRPRFYATEGPLAGKEIPFNM